MRGIVFSRKREHLAFTIVEMAMASAISSIVFIFVGYVILASAKNIRTLTNATECNKDAYLALEHVRYTLLMGRFGTTEIKDNGRTIEFVDPNLGGITSALKYNNNVLWYDKNVDGQMPLEKMMDRLIDLTFTEIHFGALIRVEVTARSRKGAILSKPVIASTDILLRNY